MEKLQYDSFYKFLVSLGTILIISPLLALYFLVNSSNAILMESDFYNALTSSSQNIVNKREGILSFVFKYSPWFLIAVFILGILAFLYGGYKWFSLQKELDQQIKLKTKEQKNIVENMSPPEIFKKTNADVQDIKTPKEANKTAQSGVLLKALSLEDTYYQMVKEKLKKKYSVRQNVKINHMEYDIVARSKFDNLDSLYEIKYWTKVPSCKKFQNVIRALEERGIKYENTMKRNFQNYLVIITTESQCSLMKISAYKWKQQMDLIKNINIEVISENDIEKEL